MNVLLRQLGGRRQRHLKDAGHLGLQLLLLLEQGADALLQVRGQHLVDRVAVKADERLQELRAQHRSPELLLAGHDLQQHGASDVRPALLLDDFHLLAVRDHFADVLERDVTAITRIVQAPVGILANQSLGGHSSGSGQGCEMLRARYAPHNHARAKLTCFRTPAFVVYWKREQATRSQQIAASQEIAARCGECRAARAHTASLGRVAGPTRRVLGCGVTGLGRKFHHPIAVIRCEAFEHRRLWRTTVAIVDRVRGAGLRANRA
jgi:hypothetical protein